MTVADLIEESNGMENKYTQKMYAIVSEILKKEDFLREKATIEALHRHGYEVLKWHQYPKESPHEDGTYIVTVYARLWNAEEVVAVTTAVWDRGEWEPLNFLGGVTAWTDTPKPFNPLIDDGNVLISATDEHVGEGQEEEEA